MARIVVNEETGAEAVLADDGALMPYYGDPGVLAFAGRTLSSIGSGMKATYGELTDQPELVRQANAESEARNRIFAGADAAHPYKQLAGSALPGLATAPIGGVAAGMGIGAAESFFDIDQGGSALARAGGGALGALLGEAGGAMLGRVINGAEGFAQALAGRTLRGTPEAEAFEALGGETLAYQRMTPDTYGQKFAERFSQGAQVGMFPSTRQGRALSANDALYKDTIADAVGLDGGLFDNLGEEFTDTAFNTIESGFSRVAETAGAVGDFDLSPLTAETLQNAGQVKQLIKLGDFKGLEQNLLTGDEWVVARRALSQDAAKAFKNGDAEVGLRYNNMVGELDELMSERVPEEFLPEFARLREQYRVLSILERPNVVGADGQVNSRTLNRALRSRNQGFGRTATRGQEAVNPETTRLLELASTGDKPQFKPHKSSGTAENQALDNFLDEGTDALTGMAQGDPTQTAGFMMRNLVAPTFDRGAEMGGGLPYDYLFNRGDILPTRQTGVGLGRSILDEAMYPFVGVDDERQP